MLARAIFQTMGSSRAAAKPWTYLGVTAASSITAPAAFAPAFAAWLAMSSIEAEATLAMAATSSRSASSPLMSFDSRLFRATIQRPAAAVNAAAAPSCGARAGHDSAGAVGGDDPCPSIPHARPRCAAHPSEVTTWSRWQSTVSAGSGGTCCAASSSSGRTDVEVLAINDLGPVETNAHLLQYDSVHGRFPQEVTVGEDWIDVGPRTHPGDGDARPGGVAVVGRGRGAGMHGHLHVEGEVPGASGQRRLPRPDLRARHRTRTRPSSTA